MAYKIFAFLVVVLFLNACASNNVEKDIAPKWIMGETQEYPRSKFLQGVGEGDTITDAKSRARAEIAKIFNVRVESTSTDRASFERSTGAEGSVSRESSAIEREIQTKTNQLLEGVQVAQVWQDKSTQRYYALAVLPRLQTMSSLRGEVTELDSATKRVINDAQQSDSLFKKIGLSANAIEFQIKRKALNKQLQVVSIAGQGIESEWSLATLKADHAELLSRINVTALTEGKSDQKLLVALTDALANQGFSVKPEGDYTVKAQLDATPLPRKGAWYYYKGTLSVSFTGEDKSSLGGHEWSFKVSASDPVLSELRVLEKAKYFLNEELDEKLLAVMNAN